MNEKNELEIRPAKPLEIPVCKILLPLPPAWLQFIRKHGLDFSKEIEETVASNTNQIDGPFVRKHFPEMWQRSFRDFVPVGSKGYTGRVVLTMRQRSWECVGEAAQSVGCTEQEIAVAIIAHCLQLRGAIPTERRVALSVSTAALDALEAEGVSVESAVSALSPRGAEDIPWRIKEWGSRARAGYWNSRKILAWMQSARRVRKVEFAIAARQLEMIEEVTAGIGITTEEWFLKAIGYRAFLEMRKPKR